MLSMAPIRSSAGATNYFAKDNYYTPEGAEGSSSWAGAGAAAMGLDGKVDADAFKAVLDGVMPDGTVLPTGPDGKRAFGSDFTFSAPKSLSLLAYIGGDNRLLDAHRRSVEKAMAWAEKNLAATRMEVDGRMVQVKTGNLVMAMFEHDTSRAQEPDAHIHVVIANATRGPDGKWRTLDNRPLWKANALIGSIQNAFLREEVTKLGYEPELVGKYGSFEIGNIARSVIMAFSTRRRQILEAFREARHQTPEARNAMTLATREKKEEIEDREGLYERWQAQARELGVDLPAIVSATLRPEAAPVRTWDRVVAGIKSMAGQARAIADYFAKLSGGDAGDALIPERIGRLDPQGRADAQSVASAIRHLSEREAAFEAHDVYKAALNFGLPVTIDGVEARIATLVGKGLLVEGQGARAHYLTTESEIRTERRILTEVDVGRGAVSPLMDHAQAGERLQEEARDIAGFSLNAGQEAGGRILLASEDRIVAIQGVAGAGKTTMLRPVKAVLEAEGKTLLGLAFQNKMVADLADAGIEARTIASFIGRYQGLLRPDAKPEWIDKARAEYRDTFIVVDESSMTSNADQLTLNRLANLLQLPRMATMGDEKQLGAINAGKPFEVMQRLGIEMAVMPENLRARGEAVKAVATAFQDGRVSDAMKALAPFTTVAPDDIDQTAVDMWMALDGQERDRTGLYASGRVHKGEINERVQQARLDAGEIGRDALSLTVLDRVGITGEETRYIQYYKPGMIVDFDRRLRGQNIDKGRATILSVDQRSRTATLKLANGKTRTFKPGRMQAAKSGETLRLYVERRLDIHSGDRIRWGDNDRDRGLLNATSARIVAWDAQGVTVETDTKMVHVLAHGDPMLDKIDLSYALNAHMAQGVTSDHGIAVMDSAERRLNNLRLALVTATRVRDSLRVIVDDPDRVARGLAANPGDKTSALEVIGEVPGRAPATASRPAAPSAPPGDWERRANEALGQPAEPAAATTQPASPPAPGRPEPEIERKIDDGSRGRQIEFDL
ncbi:MobF family relaxase [Sphingomonas oryzagri]